jgi:hypothetical protein
MHAQLHKVSAWGLGQSQDTAAYDALAARNRARLKAQQTAAHEALQQLGWAKSVRARAHTEDSGQNDAGSDVQLPLAYKRQSPMQTSSMKAHEQLLKAMEVKLRGCAEVMAIHEVPSCLARDLEKV